MKEYELWLDESGAFENDKQNVEKNLNPSLVGGILFIKKEFSGNQAKNLIGEERIHSNKEDKNNVFEKFKKITEKNVTLVEISNEECISVIDSNLTYQNIMAEGLVQVITKIREKNGSQKFKLDILIAQRGDCTNENKNDKVVSPEQYRERITERMILNGYENKIHEFCDWNIEIADAKKDQRLMIADIICNSFLTRNTKFKGEQGEYINKIHNHKDRTWRFSVFESSLEKTMKRMLLEGRLGETVISLCQSKNEQYISKKFKDISDYMENMTYDDMHLQFIIISSRISYFIKIQRAYTECLKLLDNLLEYWIPCVKALSRRWGNEIAEIMELDFYIQKYTIYTHRGALKRAEECENQCEKLFRTKRKMNVESLEYLLMYTNRKITNRINLFDFKRALQDSNYLVTRCESIKEALSLSEEGVSFDELGKALGTRAQIYMFMTRGNVDFYQPAQEDVRNAIKEFQTQSDIRRQHIYLTQIHTEAGQYDKALETLCGSSDMKEWLMNVAFNPFEVYAYIRLMAEGKKNDWEKADRMYEELNRTQIISDLKNSQNYEHPYEVIFWKLGSYYAHCEKNQKVALDSFSEALKCYGEEDKFTINVICFAAELERYAFAVRENLSEKKSYQKPLKKNFEMFFRKESTPESIRLLYNDIDFEKKDWHYFEQLSKKITY